MTKDVQHGEGIEADANVTSEAPDAAVHGDQDHGDPQGGVTPGGDVVTPPVDLVVVDDATEDEEPVRIEPYVNPEFFTPKELSQMVAGFGVQIYVAMKARDGSYSHREAIAEAVAIASLAIEDRAIGNIFAAVTEKNGFATDVLQESRRRMREMLEEQAAADAAAAAAGGD